MVRKYWKEIYRLSKLEVDKHYNGRWEVIRIVALVVVIVVAIITLPKQGGLGAVIIGVLIGEIILFVALLFAKPIASVIYMFKVPAKRDEKQRGRLELKEYEDIKIVDYHKPETKEEQIERIRTGIINPRLEVAVQNTGNASLLHCCVKIKKIEFISQKYNNPPPEFEPKPLKWEVGYTPEKGEITLPPQSQPFPLLIAISEIKPIAMFKFVYLDGVSGSFHSVYGRYILTAQVEGQAQKEERMEYILPVLFLITFDFRVGVNNPLLNLIEIKKTPRYKDNNG